MRTDDWLKQLPPPGDEGVDRVWERLEASRKAPSTRRAPLLLAAGITAAALAAGVLLQARSAPQTHTIEAVESQHVAWSAEVGLDVQGRGVAEGTPADLTVAWQEGILRAEVRPDRGNRMRVETEEAVVTVVGTVFTVERTPLGTSAWVDRGQVHVACADGSEHDLTATSGAVTCLPTRPGALLGRADALMERDATPELVLEAIERGLEAVDAGTATEGELLARRVEQRALLGDVDAVLEAATAYVDGGHSLRVDSVARTAARVATEAGRCADAAPWHEHGLPLADRLALARCWTDAGRDADAAALLRAAREAGEPVPAQWLSWLDAVEAR